MEIIVTGVFEEENAAYKALVKIKNEQSAKEYKVKQIGLILKAQGNMIPLEGEIKIKKKGTGRGGVIGGLLGLLSGPIGLLVGIGVGAGIGSAIGSGAKKHALSKHLALLKKTIEKMPDDSVILVVRADEKKSFVLDDKLERYGATVSRFDVEELSLEIKEAKKRKKEMKRQKKNMNGADGAQPPDDEIWGRKEE